MGGPAVGVLLGFEPGEANLDALRTLLESLSAPRGDEISQEVLIETTKPIGGTYSGDSRPIGFDWLSGASLDVRHEDAARETIRQAFGLDVKSDIALTAFCNSPDDHRVLGELALHLAVKYGGVVDFGGVLTVSSTELPRDAPGALWFFENAEWSMVAEPIGRFFRTMPGKIVAVPYETSGNRTWATHVGDTAFMAGWLEHSEFRLIKEQRGHIPGLQSTAPAAMPRPHVGPRTWGAVSAAGVVPSVP